MLKYFLTMLLWERLGSSVLCVFVCLFSPSPFSPVSVHFAGVAKVGQGAWPGDQPTCTAAGYPAISFCSAVADSLITAAVFRPGWNLSLAPDCYSYQSDLLCCQPFTPQTFHLLVWIPVRVFMIWTCHALPTPLQSCLLHQRS